jgi:penicillin amidase
MTIKKRKEKGVRNMTLSFLNRNIIETRGKSLALLLLLITGLLIYAIPPLIMPASSVPTGAYITVGGTDILAVNLDGSPLLENNVTFYRDNYGVPHIYAESTADAYVAVGYCMAQDRLFEMDLIRRYAAGRLSEILGPDQLSTDIAARTMGFYKIAEDTWDGVYAPDVTVSSEAKENLESFAAGVNLYTSLYPDGIHLLYGALMSAGVPAALCLPNMTQNLWKPQDSLVVAGFMGWDLTDSSQAEIIRGAYVQNVDPVYALQGLPGMSDFLMPTGWINATTILDPPGGGGGGGGNYEVYEALQKLNDVVAPFASNNWVINETVSETGNAMLCNDPHLMLQTPGINWEVHIKTPEINVIGCMIPGGPVVYTGHNEHFAFGVTNLMADVLDLYYYVFDNPADPTSYWYEPLSTWLPIQQEVEYITVVGTPVPVTINSTIHGPLIDTPAGKFAFKWVGKQSGYGEITGFNNMMKATNRAEWKEACSHMCVIIQNYVYADKDGNISWCPSGRLPVRDPTVLPATMGTAPSNGSAGQNEWIPDVYIPHSTSPGMIPPYPSPVSLPYIDDPPEGFIVTANNQPIDPNWPGYPWPVWIGPGYTFAPGYRAQRITELISTLAPISVDDMKAIQVDNLCIPARDIVPILLGVMGGDPNATITAALAILTAWNFTELRGLAAPLIWEVFYNKFRLNTFWDEFGAAGLYPVPNDIIPLWNMCQTWNTNPYAIALFDDITTPSGGPFTPGFELMPDIMNRSLHDALDWIASELGPNMATWKYGDIHVVQFEHWAAAFPLPYLSVPFNPPFGPGPVGMDGGPYTVNPGGHHHQLIVAPGVDRFLVTHGASYRGIYECKDDWDTSWIVVPPGESGLITGFVMAPVHSPHYQDQFPLWLGNAYGWTPCLYDDGTIMGYPKTTLHPDFTPPVADIADCPKTVPRNVVVSFDGTGSYDNVGIVVWEWDFGDPYDPTKKYTPIVTHTFTHPLPSDGIYTVTLTVWDAEGFSDTATCQVNVFIPVGGSAEPLTAPTVIPPGLWIGLALIVMSLAATAVFFRLKRKKKE